MLDNETSNYSNTEDERLITNHKKVFKISSDIQSIINHDQPNAYTWKQHNWKKCLHRFQVTDLRVQQWNANEVIMSESTKIISHFTYLLDKNKTVSRTCH
jgi:hypothetical protein